VGALTSQHHGILFEACLVQPRQPLESRCESKQLLSFGEAWRDQLWVRAVADLQPRSSYVLVNLIDFDLEHRQCWRTHSLPLPDLVEQQRWVSFVE